MQATLVDGLGVRLREALGGRSYHWLSEQTGISTSMLSDYGKGTKTPGADKAVLIADVLGVEIAWLLTGRGSSSGRYILPDDIAEQYGLALGSSVQHPNSSLHSGAFKLPRYNAPDERRHDGDMVEVYQIDLSFGLGAAVMDTEIFEDQAAKLEFPRSWLRMITPNAPSLLCWARCKGDSMYPTIGDGDVALIDRGQRSLLDADLIWAASYGSAGIVKRLRPMPDGGVKIMSDNVSVDPETAYDGELSIFGRVIAVIKRL